MVAGQDSLVKLEEQAVITAVEAISPAVVRIETIGGLELVNKSQVNLGPTTGIVISEDGFILSSSFNFIQDPASIIVRFENGTKAPAAIVARDHSRKIVLLKCEVEETLQPVELADPDRRGSVVHRQWRARPLSDGHGVVGAGPSRRRPARRHHDPRQIQRDGAVQSRV